jgi:hypothetical protein
MVLSSYGVMSGALTVGDLVILHANPLRFYTVPFHFLDHVEKV